MGRVSLADRIALRPTAILQAMLFRMISIIGPPALPFAYLYKNAKAQQPSPDPWYLQKALPALWDTGIQHGVDPVVMAAQCALETNWGRFGGAITHRWGNTCGLKHRWATGDEPDDHQRFRVESDGRPAIGAMAHAQHLRAYCGFTPPHPTISISVDARFELARKPIGEVLFVEDLSGRWAPGKDYGQKVAAIYLRLCGGERETVEYGSDGDREHKEGRLV